MFRNMNKLQYTTYREMPQLMFKHEYSAGKEAWHGAPRHVQPQLSCRMRVLCLAVRRHGSEVQAGRLRERPRPRAHLRYGARLLYAVLHQRCVFLFSFSTTNDAES